MLAVAEAQSLSCEYRSMCAELERKQCSWDCNVFISQCKYEYCRYCRSLSFIQTEGNVVYAPALSQRSLKCVPSMPNGSINNSNKGSTTLFCRDSPIPF